MQRFNKNLAAIALAVSILSGFPGQAVFAANPAAVNLGSAGNYAVLSKTGISTTGSTSVAGDMGISPAAATYITGFGFQGNLNDTMADLFLGILGGVLAGFYGFLTEK